MRLIFICYKSATLKIYGITSICGKKGLTAMSYTSTRNLRLQYPFQLRGVTLIESIVVLAIIAIVASMAVPTFSLTIARNRMASYTNEFLGFLSYARSEAITRGRRVIVCKSEDGKTCTIHGGWEQGWIVFVDKNNNFLPENEEILRVHDKLNSHITIIGEGYVDDYIAYSSDGRTRMNFGDFQEGNLSLCDNSGNGLKNAIVIEKVGRAGSDKDCKTCPSPISPCTECRASCPQ